MLSSGAIRASTVYVIFRHSTPSSSTFAGKCTISLNAHKAGKIVGPVVLLSSYHLPWHITFHGLHAEL